jgi:hypothetical protein
MANITLTNQTNSPVQIDTTHFGVGVATSATLVGTDLQIAEVYRDAGLGVMSEGTPPDFEALPTIEEADGDLVVSFVVSGDPTPSIEYTWLTSETEEGTYTEVPGATTDTLTSPVAGWYKASVKATNTYGTVTDESVPFEVEA